MTDIHIREARHEDIPDLCRLMEELSGQPISPEDMRNRLDWVQQSPQDTLWVYEEANRVKAALAFRIRENIREVSRYGEICIVVVSSSSKRQGIGQRLMSFAEEKAREWQCIGTYLISGFGRADEAHRFYRDLGYEITGYRFVKRL